MKSCFSIIAMLFALQAGLAQQKTDSLIQKSDSLSTKEPPISLAEKPEYSRNPVLAEKSQWYPEDRQVFKVRKLYVPAGLAITGLALNSNNSESLKNEIVEERNEHFPNFKFHADDFLQFSPIVAAYGLDAFGIKSKTDLPNRTAILVKSELGMLAATMILKNTTHIQRPDGSGYNSFPSGHTAQAFAAATFLSEEYKDQFKWMPYVAYGVASGVGALRIANNKHYISDVLVGAALGILSTKIAYWTHHYQWGKKKN